MPLTDKKVGTRLRETIGDFYGMMRVMRSTDPLRDQFRVVKAPSGFFKIGDVYPKGEVEDASGFPTVNTLDSASKEYKTKPRRYTLGLDYETWLTANTITSGQVQQAIAMSAGKLEHDRRKRMAALLKAGSVGTDIFVLANGDPSPFFDQDAKFIPGTTKSFINEFSGAYSGSAAEMQAAILDVGLAKFDEMESTIGFVHTPPEEGAGFVAIVPPALRGKVHAAIATAPGASSFGVEKFNVTYRVNPLLSAAQGGSDTTWYLSRADAVFSPFVYGERGPEEFRQSIPNAGDQAHLILFNAGLWQPYYAAEVAYGSAFNILKFIDA
jgi:hypothetical protein